MSHNDKVRQALLSVADKRGVEEFGRGLLAAGYQLLSTGGTLSALAAAGLPVKAVEELTGYPEMLDGRVKTLHPAVHAGILHRRDLASHQADLEQHGIAAIDLVAVNLYPFEQAWQAGAAGLELLEQIDIGGPAMIRAAAKNWPWVTVVTDPDQYDAVLAALAQNRGRVPASLRRRLAARAFAHTAYYDALVAAGLEQMDGVDVAADGSLESTAGEPQAGARGREGDGSEEAVNWPETIVVPLRRHSYLRYGENPHQPAALYADASLPPRVPAVEQSLLAARQLQGKELSFNNLQDAQAAVSLVMGLTEPAAAAVKHKIPCGAACAPTLAAAFRRARDADPVSIFGGIVAFNKPLDEETAALLAEIFLEVVLAPAVTPAAERILSERKNLRVLLVPALAADDVAAAAAGLARVSRVGLRGLDARRLHGGLLLQGEDRVPPPDPSRWQVVTEARPDPATTADQQLAWHLVRQLPSNAIVFVKDQRTVGIGAARTSRVDAVRLAAEQAGPAAEGAVMASDAFFPFPDGVEVAARAGVKVVVQPGGSVRDEEVIAACNRFGVAMVMTGIRHFRH